MIVSTTMAHIKRFPCCNTTWKLHRITTTPLLICGRCAFYVGATWNKKNTGRMMNQEDVYNKAAHSKLKSNGAETKPLINSDRLLFCIQKR
jgi:hypothetical protein